MARRWYVARTRPMVEHAALDHLRSDGFEAFVPCTRTLHARRGRREVPLFPGYLFLRYDLEQEGSRPLRLVPHLRGLVTFEGVAPPVPDHVVEDLAQKVEQMNAGQGLWRRPRPGDQMTVAIGRTQTMAQVVAQAKSPHARVRVLLDFLGTRVPAQVSPESLEFAIGAIRPTAAPHHPPRRTRGSRRWIRGQGPQTGDQPAKGAPSSHNGWFSLS